MRAVVGGTVLALAAACGVGDQTAQDAETERLSQEAQSIVSAAQDAAAGRDHVTAAMLVSELTSRIPAEPVGYKIKASVPKGTNRAEVGFALDGKVDGLGPGQTTQTLRLCVLVSLTPPPEMTSQITDLDCTDLVPRANAIVEFTG